MLQPNVRWWNRDRLLLVILTIHAVTLVIDASRAAMPPTTGLPTLIVDLMLVLGYATLAPRVGAMHLRGETRPAFLRDVWYRHWAGDDGLARRAWSLNTLEDEDDARDAMHRALSMLEGVRLQDPAGAAALAIALLAGAPGLWFTRPGSVPLDLAFWSAFVPVILVFLLDPFLDFRAGRELHDRRAVNRIASLTPRRLRDLGVSTPLLVVAGAFPLALVALSLARHPERLFGSLGLLVYLWGIIALTYWLLRRLPFLHFPGPPEISVFLDVQYRAQRIWLLLNSVIAVALVWRGMAWPDEIPVLAQLSMAAIIAILLLRALSCRYLGPVIDDQVLEAARRSMDRWMPPRPPTSRGRPPGTR